MYGLANMSLFLIEINLLAALFAIQFLGGDIQSGESIDFGTLYNTFLAIYQVFSSENWTDVLYLASVPEVPLRQAAITVIFIAGWMFFANCAWHSSCVQLWWAHSPRQTSCCKCSLPSSTRTST